MSSKYELIRTSFSYIRCVHSHFVQAQTLVIQSPLKCGENCIHLECLAKVTPLSLVMLYVTVDIKIVSYVYYVLYK